MEYNTTRVLDQYTVLPVGGRQKMKASEQTAEVIDFEEVAQAKAAGSGGGFDHFTGMTIGTRFVSQPNGRYDSECDEYVLLSKAGPTVLLQNEGVLDSGNQYYSIYGTKEIRSSQQRHIGSKFWKLNTLVQILHIPDASETGPPPHIVGGRTTNGTSNPD